ncbi:MAG: glycosyltransferase family 2 protein, partial [Candidatus Thioglobus sp.]
MIDLMPQKVKTSLIIPTLNRFDDLRACLNSIGKLNQSFDEIIIVEQGDIAKTKTIIADFNNLTISLYFHSVKSAAQARNIGIEKSSGNLVFFIDDDTDLDEKNYIDIAINCFKNNPKMMGLTGKIKSISIFKKPTFGTKWLRKLYQWFIKIVNITLLYDGLKMQVLKSGINTHGAIECQKQCDIEWTQGCNMVFRKEVFDKFKFNQNFLAWSCAEDVMLSY